MKIACGLTKIRRVTVSTFKKIESTRFHVLGNLILERKERGNVCRRMENKCNVNVREGSVAEAVKLAAYFERVLACVGKAEIHEILGNRGK